MGLLPRVVEGEGNAADGVREGELRTGDGGGEGVGRVAVVCDGGRADGVSDGDAVVGDGELLRGGVVDQARGLQGGQRGGGVERVGERAGSEGLIRARCR